MQSCDDFKPIPNRTTKGRFPLAGFIIRRIFDFQLLTIYLHGRSFFARARGTVMDVGCGDCAYKEFLDPSVKYIGLDVKVAEDFDYGSNNDIVFFDGSTIPFPDHSANHVICTEVLEHVSHPETLIGEIHRVLMPGGTAFVTIPWSARFHYIPYDYGRYTPTKLQELFSPFSAVTITPRGTDIAVICNKLIVFTARQVSSNGKITYWKLPLIALFSPVLVLIVLWGQGAIWFGWGSKNDPLGYTIDVTK